MPYLLGLSLTTPAVSGIDMYADWNTDASDRLLWQIFSTFPGSSRLSVLWIHDRRRYHKWNRTDEVTAREQHHPDVTYPGDEIWWLARLQTQESVGVCWRKRKSVVWVSPTHLTTGVGITRIQTVLTKCCEIRNIGLNDLTVTFLRNLTEIRRRGLRYKWKFSCNVCSYRLFVTDSTFRSFPDSKILIDVCVSFARLTWAEEVGSQTRILLHGLSACTPAPTWGLFPGKALFSARQRRELRLKSSVSALWKACLSLRKESGRLHCSTHVCFEIEIKGKGKRRKRAATARSCCGCSHREYRTQSSAGRYSKLFPSLHFRRWLRFLLRKWTTLTPHTSPPHSPSPPPHPVPDIRSNHVSLLNLDSLKIAMNLIISVIFLLWIISILKKKSTILIMSVLSK